MYFPDQYYVTLRQRDTADSVPLGFPVPDGDDTAAKKRKESANRWAGLNAVTPDPARLIVFKNEAMEGFTFSKSVRRYGYFGAGNVVWRVEHPLGFEFEISSENLAQFILNSGVVEGKIVGKCILARDGARNALIHESCPDYQKILTDTGIKYAKPITMSKAKVQVGDTLVLQSKDTTGPVRYVGKVVGTWLIRQSADKHRPESGHSLGELAYRLSDELAAARHLFVSTTADNVYHLIAEPKIVQHTSFNGTQSQRDEFQRDSITRLNAYVRRTGFIEGELTGTDSGCWWQIRGVNAAIMLQEHVKRLVLQHVPVEVTTSTVNQIEDLTVYQLGEDRYQGFAQAAVWLDNFVKESDRYCQKTAVTVSRSCAGFNVVGAKPEHHLDRLYYRKRGTSSWIPVMGRSELFKTTKRVNFDGVEYPLFTVATPTWNRSLLDEICSKLAAAGNKHVTDYANTTFSDDSFIGVYSAEYITSRITADGQQVITSATNLGALPDKATSIGDLTQLCLGFAGVVFDRDPHWHRSDRKTSSAARADSWPLISDVGEISEARGMWSFSMKPNAHTYQILGRCDSYDNTTGEFLLCYNDKYVSDAAAKIVMDNIISLQQVIQQPDQYEFSMLAMTSIDPEST